MPACGQFAHIKMNMRIILFSENKALLKIVLKKYKNPPCAIKETVSWDRFQNCWQNLQN